MTIKIEIEGTNQYVTLCTIKEHGELENIIDRYTDSGIREKFISIYNVLHYDHRTQDNIRPYSTCYDPRTEILEITYHTLSLI